MFYIIMKMYIYINATTEIFCFYQIFFVWYSVKYGGGGGGVVFFSCCFLLLCYVLVVIGYFKLKEREEEEEEEKKESGWVVSLMD
jgi:hypothetical protein